MSDLYTELLVKRTTPQGEKALKAGLIAVTAVTAIAGLFLHPLIFIAFAGMLILDYFKMPAFDLEFEYLYVNGELDIDKIMSKQKRKKVLSIGINDMELIAPKNSHELDYYRQNKSLKVRDFSSGEERANVFAIIVKKDNQTEMVLFEPNDVILNDMRRIAPRKVKLG